MPATNKMYGNGIKKGIKVKTASRKYKNRKQIAAFVLYY